MAFIVVIMDYVNDGNGYQFEFIKCNNKASAMTEACGFIASFENDKTFNTLIESTLDWNKITEELGRGKHFNSYNNREGYTVYIKHTQFPERYTSEVADFLNHEIHIEKVIIAWP